MPMTKEKKNFITDYHELHRAWLKASNRREFSIRAAAVADGAASAIGHLAEADKAADEIAALGHEMDLVRHQINDLSPVQQTIAPGVVTEILREAAGILFLGAMSTKGPGERWDPELDARSTEVREAWKRKRAEREAAEKANTETPSVDPDPEEKK